MRAISLCHFPLDAKSSACASLAAISAFECFISLAMVSVPWARLFIVVSVSAYKTTAAKSSSEERNLACPQRLTVEHAPGHPAEAMVFVAGKRLGKGKGMAFYEERMNHADEC